MSDPWRDIISEEKRRKRARESRWIVAILTVGVGLTNFIPWVIDYTRERREEWESMWSRVAEALVEDPSQLNEAQHKLYEAEASRITKALLEMHWHGGIQVKAEFQDMPGNWAQLVNYDFDRDRVWASRPGPLRVILDKDGNVVGKVYGGDLDLDGLKAEGITVQE